MCFCFSLGRIYGFREVLIAVHNPKKGKAAGWGQPESESAESSISHVQIPILNLASLTIFPSLGWHSNNP